MLPNEGLLRKLWSAVGFDISALIPWLLSALLERPGVLSSELSSEEDCGLPSIPPSAGFDKRPENAELPAKVEAPGPPSRLAS